MMKQLPRWRRPYSAKRLLEIGPGHNPFVGVTHLLERYVSDGHERCGNALLVPTSARLIVGEAAFLPFAKRAFDFVYASHVLEHVEDPVQACREIMRVGAAGYIETPSPFLEQGLAIGDESSPEHWFHRWFVFSWGSNRLVFEPKSVEEVARFCSCRDGQFLREFYAAVDFREAQHCFRRSAKTTISYWKSSFQVEVRDRMTDCQQDKRPCRFSGMRHALVSNGNDLLRARRVRRLTQSFPEVRAVFRKFGQYSLLVH
jgi:SAM-dependent methyltransferase